MKVLCQHKNLIIIIPRFHYGYRNSYLFSYFSMDVFLRGVVPVTDLYASGEGYKAILLVWKELPLAAVIIPLFAVYGFVATWTTQQAYSYNVAMATEVGVTADNEPSVKNRLLWTVLLHVYCFAVIFLGGMDTVKASSVISGLPAILVSSLVIISTMKDMKKVWGEEEETAAETETFAGVQVAQDILVQRE